VSGLLILLGQGLRSGTERQVEGMQLSIAQKDGTVAAAIQQFPIVRDHQVRQRPFGQQKALQLRLRQYVHIGLPRAARRAIYRTWILPVTVY